MGNIYVLIGQTASGKTEIFNRLIKNNKYLTPIITSTSRPPRPEEEEGKDYYFESHEYMEEHEDRYLCMNTFEVEPYGLCFYGIDPYLNDLEDNNVDKIVILSPNGYRELKKLYGDRVIGYYIMASEDVRRERYLSRENYSFDARNRINRRINADLKDFKDFEFEVEELIVNQTKEQLENAITAISFDIELNAILERGV